MGRSGLVTFGSTFFRLDWVAKIFFLHFYDFFYLLLSIKT